MTTRVMHNRLVRLVIVVGSLAAATGTVVATGAFAANGQRVHRHVAGASAARWHLSIFSHHASSYAHSADVARASAPEGAIFAATSHADGETNELYAWRRAPQEDCLVTVEGDGTSIGCSPASVVEAEGMSSAGPVSGTSGPIKVLAMVPDGVSTVEVVNGEGTANTVEVVNNVADYTTASVKELRYALPNGTVESVDFENRYDNG